MMAYLVVDAGGTFLKSAVLTSEGKVLPNSDYSIPSNSEDQKEAVLNAFADIISCGLRFIENEKRILAGIGFAFPGPFHIEKGIPLMKHKFQSIYGLDLRECFYKMTGISSNVPIQFIHDANAVLVGELWKGGARGFKNAAVVTLGTGLGFAMSKNGKVLCNEIGGPYLSIFKLPYRHGILEDYTAQRGFLRSYGELSGESLPSGFSVADIAKLADRGDEDALKTFQKAGKVLAKALYKILLENEIECLLFSGQISKSFKFMESVIRTGLNSVDCLKTISVVENINHAALLGTLKNIV